MVGRHAFGIPGWPPDESEKLLDELVEFACQPPRMYHHTGQQATRWCGTTAR